MLDRAVSAYPNDGRAMPLSIYPLAVRGLTWPVLKSHEFSTIVQQAANFYTTRIINSQNPIWHWTLVYEYLKDNPQDLVSTLAPYTDYRFLEGFLLANQGQFAEFLFDDLSDDTIGMRSQQPGSPVYPSVFRTSTNYYLGSYIVDNNATPHLQLVTVAGQSGTTVPAFSVVGGTVISGAASFQDQGVFNGALAQTLAVVTDGLGNYFSPIQRNFGGQFLEDVTDLNTSVYPLTIWAYGVKQTPPAYQLLGPGLAIPGSSYQGLYLQWYSQPALPVTALGQFYYRVRLESDSQDIEQFMQQLWTVGGSSGKNGSGMLKLLSSRLARV